MTGHGREEIGFLIFPNVAACRALCPELSAEAPVRMHRADLVAHLYSDVPDGSIIALGAI